MSYSGVMAQPVSIYDAKTQLSQLVTRAENGEEIVISRHGRPVARLVALDVRRPDRIPGQFRGRITIAADFDTAASTDETDWYGA
jgi:prevent-host-death family protein